MTESRIRVAILCDRIGPYHVARLNASQLYMQVTAIEFSMLDNTYAWDLCKGQDTFERVTLFSDQPISEQPRIAVINRVKQVLSELHPQVVVISGWDAPASLIALNWCLKNSVPTVLMSESQYVDEKRTWWKEAIKSRIVRLNSSGFAGGIPHKDYLHRLGMPLDRITTGCDVIDNDYFSAAVDEVRRNERDLRRKYGLPEKYFLTSCRFVQKKNLPSVLRGYAEYLKAAGDKPWHLLVLGDGPLKDDLLCLRRELALEKMVLMPGFAQYPDLPVYYGLAGAFVLASTTEQWGLVVNEAMASGLPVIVSNRCGCALDLVSDRENGFTFKPDDITSLAAHFGVIAGDEVLCKAMAEAGQRKISGWKPELFGERLREAVDMALAAPLKKFSLPDKFLLNKLFWK